MNIFDQLAKILAEELFVEIEDIKQESTLQELGADSLDFLQIKMVLEHHFKVKFPENITFLTVGELEQYLLKA